MKHLSFVIAYYRNPSMLAEQYRVWAGYPADLKSRIDVVLVDDGSPEPAFDVPRPVGLPLLSIYRVGVDRPWHQHPARNLGAHVAEGPWLFLTDMDHILPAPSLAALLGKDDTAVAYTFGRLNAPDMEPARRPDGSLKPHPNTFAMTKKTYWRVGGYDEDYAGIYGTDGMFRRQLFPIARECHLPDVPVIQYSTAVIADANTLTLPRKEGRDPGAKTAVAARKRAEGRANKIVTLNFPWERVL